MTSKKRPQTLDGFFTSPAAKKQKQDTIVPSTETSNHATYPFAIPHLPPTIGSALDFAPTTEGIKINNQPDLDLLYFQPYLSAETSRQIYTFLRSSLFFYRVRYTIKRGATETTINTPRFTTVFGVDDSSRFNPSGSLIDAHSLLPIPRDRYKCRPRPIPHCLDALRTVTQGSTDTDYNFCLVNYYAGGGDSISYHSDDERFLGPEPAIASFSLGARRDFCMKHKPPPPADSLPPATASPAAAAAATREPVDSRPLKVPLASGDMILMRGRTQANWLHSIPKRKGNNSEREGRINITFRKAMVRGGTENYYRYNVGDGEVYRWDEGKEEMGVWKG